MLLQQSVLKTQQQKNAHSQHPASTAPRDSNPRTWLFAKPAPPSQVPWSLTCLCTLTLHHLCEKWQKSLSRFRGWYYFNNHWQIWGTAITELCPHKTHTVSRGRLNGSPANIVCFHSVLVPKMPGILAPNIANMHLMYEYPRWTGKSSSFYSCVEAVMAYQEWSLLQSMCVSVRHSLMRNLIACCFNLNRCIQYII